LLPRLRSFPWGKGSGTSHGPAQGCLGHLRRLACRSRAGHGPLAPHTQPAGSVLPLVRGVGGLSPSPRAVRGVWTFDFGSVGAPCHPTGTEPRTSTGSYPWAAWGQVGHLGNHHSVLLDLGVAPEIQHLSPCDTGGVSSSPSNMHASVVPLGELWVSPCSVLCAGLDDGVLSFLRRVGPVDPQHHAPLSLPWLQGLLTLFAKSFASFNHSTCALSVSRRVFCLARDTPGASNCSPKPLYSGIRTASPRQPPHTGQCRG
jgi:hypothetical protein